ncbi:MAG: DUF222 domain-containing protein [Gammaproteobacteria bacterium]
MNRQIAAQDRSLAIEELDQSIVNLCARINAANYELLTLVREFDERAGFLKWGLSTCTEWLHWRCDISLSAAREKVRVAHALKGLPEISTVFSQGVLSYSKVRALTRVANVDNEARLRDCAMTTTAARVEERCRQLRNVHPEATGEANRVHRGRSLQSWRNPERGTLTLTVEVPIEEGELIEQALAKAMEEDGAGNGPEFASVSFAAQRADALVRLARASLSGSSQGRSSSADAYQVVVHVDEAALTQGEGRSDLPLEAVKRLTCDGTVVSMVDNARGEPLSVGRKRRTVSTAIKRALWARDRGCAFPGCTHTRFVDAHHVRHWAQGGATDLGNLILLCTRHHRLVHEEGYAVHKDYRGQWYFQRGDGRAVPSCGYLPQDIIDDDIGDDSNACRHPSAEAFADGCAESTARYGPGEHDFEIRGGGVRFIAGAQGPV